LAAEATADAPVSVKAINIPEVIVELVHVNPVCVVLATVKVVSSPAGIVKLSGAIGAVNADHAEAEAGAFHVPSPRKNVVVLFGYIGAKPCIVAETLSVVTFDKVKLASFIWAFPAIATVI
jgi:hypothetical protein